MLVLTRKPGEQVIIQGNITITIVSVGPGRVKIGIVAPPDVKVDREEVHARKQDEALPAPAMIPAPLTAKPPMPAAPLPEPAAPAVVHNRIAGKLPLLASARMARRKPR